MRPCRRRCHRPEASLPTESPSRPMNSISHERDQAEEDDGRRDRHRRSVACAGSLREPRRATASRRSPPTRTSCPIDEQAETCRHRDAAAVPRARNLRETMARSAAICGFAQSASEIAQPVPDCRRTVDHLCFKLLLPIIPWVMLMTRDYFPPAEIAGCRAFATPDFDHEPFCFRRRQPSRAISAPPPGSGVTTGRMMFARSVAPVARTSLATGWRMRQRRCRYVDYCAITGRIHSARYRRRADSVDVAVGSRSLLRELRKTTGDEALPLIFCS